MNYVPPITPVRLRFRDLECIPKEYSGITTKGTFDCGANRLTSLTGGPKMMKDTLFGSDNVLFSLDFIPRMIKRVMFTL